MRNINYIKFLLLPIIGMLSFSLITTSSPISLNMDSTRCIATYTGGDTIVSIFVSTFDLLSKYGDSALRIAYKQQVFF